MGRAMVWVVAWLGVCAAFAGEDAERRVYRADAVWKPVDTAPLSVVPGSALDLSGLVEPGPAGRYGRAVVGADGGLAFPGRPDRPTRFFAFNLFVNHLMQWKETRLLASTVEETRANLREFAAKARRQGYGMIRLQSLDLWLMGGERSDYARFDPERWDHFCYLVHCLKQEGIYFGIDLFGKTGYVKYPNLWTDTLKRRYRERLFFDPDARQMWLDGARAVLTSPNPHTGLTLAEEPALVFVDFANEQELGVRSVPDPFAIEGVRPLAEAAYRDFLRRRYGGDLRRLADAWRSSRAPSADFGDFDAILLPTRADYARKDTRGDDANAFLFEREAEMLAFYRNAMADIGFDGLGTLYDVLGYLRYIDLHRDVPVVTTHGYHYHPSNKSVAGSRMDQTSMAANKMQYFRYMSGVRLWNRPLLITEYNAPFWGRYRHQEGLAFASYAALQDYSAITAHSLVVTRFAHPLEDFQLGRDPVGRAGQVVAAFAYGRGDVAPARKRVGVALPNAYLRAPRRLSQGLGAEQNHLSLLTGFGVILEGRPPAGLPDWPKPDLLLGPAGGTEILAADLFAVPVDTVEAGGLGAMEAKLRRTGILPPGNVTDMANGVFQSDTGEITLRSAENLLTVDTPRLQGTASPGGREVALRDVAFTPSLPSAATLIALDGQPIRAARRLLLVFATDVVNSDMEVSGDRTVLHRLGKLPALMETGRLSATVRNARRFACHSLAQDGRRLDEIPVVHDGETLRLDIDTATLPSGPALYFELVARSESP